MLKTHLLFMFFKRCLCFEFNHCKTVVYRSSLNYAPLSFSLSRSVAFSQIYSKRSLSPLSQVWSRRFSTFLFCFVYSVVVCCYFFVKVFSLFLIFALYLFFYLAYSAARLSMLDCVQIMCVHSTYAYIHRYICKCSSIFICAF